MKTTILSGVAAVALATGLAACTDSWNVYQEAAGRIAPLVGLDSEAVTSRSADTQSRADNTAATVEASDLSLRLVKADGSFTQEWPIAADFPTDKDFPVGEYTLEAFYGDIAEQGFDMPAYFGSQNLVVADGKATQVALTATLANAMLSVRYTDAFTGYMTDWCARVNGVTYAKDETRPVYVTPGDVKIAVTVTKPNGISTEITLPTVEAKARYHYIVTVDVNSGNVGDAALVVNFDENLDKEVVEIDLSDKVLSSPAPELTAVGFTPETPVEVVSGMSSDESLRMNLMAMAGLNEVTLTTASTSLLKQGWPASIDLMAATPAQQAILTELGLGVTGLWRNPAEMAVVDFSNVVKHIKVIADDSNTSTFTLTVKDKISRESEPMTLTLNVEDINLTLDKTEQSFSPGSPLDVLLGFNGKDVKDNVSFEYMHAVSGVWRPLEILSVAENTTRAMTSYRVTLATPELDDAITLRARCAGKIANQLTVKMAPFGIVVNDNDVFARTAALSVVGIDGEPDPSLDGAQFLLAPQGSKSYTAVSHTLEGSKAILSGLTPDTAYSVKVKIGDDTSKAATFTTEAATQLENGNMETWSITASESNWQRYDVAGWATYNAMTTMTSGTRHNTAYVSRSGTAETTDAHSGSKAAELRTIGWGAGNGAYGSINSSNPKYIDKGMLYLGGSPTDRSQLEAQATKGISFSSRPAAISFWYKFAAKNSADYGGMLVWVKDAAGNVIASGNASNLNASSYTQITVPLTYESGSAKAATIYVEFASSDNPAYATRSKDWFTVPSFGNMSDGKFQGSSLFIDDIELIY